MTAEDIGWANAEQTRLYRNFQRFFDGVDALITPAAAVPPFPVEQPYCTHIDGNEMDGVLPHAAIRGYRPLFSFNAARGWSHHPALPSASAKVRS